MTTTTQQEGNSTHNVVLTLSPDARLEGTWDEIREFVGLCPEHPSNILEGIEQAMADGRLLKGEDGVYRPKPKTAEQVMKMTDEEMEAMEAITEGTNMEGLTPDQAYDLDQRIMDAVGCSATLGVPHERFLELCDAARDAFGFLDRIRHPQLAN
jgi:hypothetical protein